MALIRRGDIRWFRFEHPDKRRPVLVVCRDTLVSSLSLVPVIPLSSQIRGLPSEVMLTPSDGVPDEYVLKPEWIRAVERVLEACHAFADPSDEVKLKMPPPRGHS